MVQEKPSHPLEKGEVSPEDLNSWFRCVAIDQARLVLGVGLISMESLLLGPVIFIEHTFHMLEKIIDLVIPPTSFSPTVSLLGCYICITLGCPMRMQSLMDHHQNMLRDAPLLYPAPPPSKPSQINCQKHNRNLFV